MPLTDNRVEGILHPRPCGDNNNVPLWEATTLWESGVAYAEYEPAYRYGYELGTHERYRGRDWAALEAEARRDWEARHPSTWERFKEAIRYGWDKVRARI